VLQIDKNGDGYIDLSELKEALDCCGFKLPGWKVRQMIEEYDDKRQIQHRGRLSFDEFEKVFLVLLCKMFILNPYMCVKFIYFCETTCFAKAHEYVRHSHPS
jgi:hypothetical protein